MNLLTRIKRAASNRAAKLAMKQQSENENRRKFREWCMHIMREVGNLEFKIGDCHYRTEIVDWRSEIKVVLMRDNVRWKDIEDKGKHHPWFIVLVRIIDRGSGYWQVDVFRKGKFHQYSDLPDGKTDCYCTPENRDRRIPEIKQMAEDALIEFINPKEDSL